jgi:hypothetical protein
MIRAWTSMAIACAMPSMRIGAVASRSFWRGALTRMTLKVA